MDASHDRDITSRVQGQNAQIIHSFIQIAIASGGAFIPPEGVPFDAVAWGAFLRIEPGTFRDAINDNDVAYIESGGKKFVDAADFKAAFKKVRWSQVKKSRGGNRRKPKG